MRREVLRRGCRVQALRPHLGEIGLRKGVDRGDPLVELVQFVRDSASPELQHLGRRVESHIRGRRDLRQYRENRGGDRLAELVSNLVGVASCVAVPEPEVPRRHIAAAALQEEALHTRDRTLDRHAQWAGELRVPFEDVPSLERRMAGETGNDGDRHAVLAVDTQHGHAVVDRSLSSDTVDAHARSAADARPDARGPALTPGRVHGPGELVGQHVGVAIERGYVREPADRRAAGDARSAVIVSSVHEHGLWGDPRQLVHEPSRLARSARRRRRRGRPRRSRRRGGRRRARALGRSSDRGRRRRGPVRSDQQPGGRPHGGVMSTRATPAVRVAMCRLLSLVGGLTGAPSGRRRSPVDASSARTRGSLSRAR